MNIVILDRDGVINEDSAAYIKSADEWHAIDGSLAAIANLTKQGFRVFVASNQSGLGRGLFDQAALDAMHNKMRGQLADAGGKIERIFYCPHKPADQCPCRKPSTGLLAQLEQHLGETVDGAYFVGDSLKDMQLAIAKQCIPLLVLTGNGTHTAMSDEVNEHQIQSFDNLLAASHYILASEPLRNSI